MPGGELSQARTERPAVIRDLHCIVEAAAGAATDDEHDPEGSTTAFEQAQVAALLGQARGHLAAVESTGHRLRTGTYGRCQRCGLPIAAERLLALLALPATTRCILGAAGLQAT